MLIYPVNGNFFHHIFLSCLNERCGIDVYGTGCKKTILHFNQEDKGSYIYGALSD